MGDVGVDLLQGDERHVCLTEGIHEAVAILVDAVAAVPIGIAEVQNFFSARAARLLRFENTDAAGARAEAVNEPVEFSERKKFENLQARGGAKAPGRRDGDCGGAFALRASFDARFGVGYGHGFPIIMHARIVGRGMRSAKTK